MPYSDVVYLSANISLFDDNLFESISLNCAPQTPQWLISINDSWRYLGWELSAALEIAYIKGLPGVNFDQYLKVCRKRFANTYCVQNDTPPTVQRLKIGWLV